MRHFKWLIGFLVLGVMLQACPQRPPAGAQPQRRVTLTRVVRIPVRVLTADTSRAALRENPGVLTLTSGAADELPQGPTGFEVLAGGGLVITDPLERRLVFYDSLGNFLRELRTGFAAATIARLPNDELEVSEATSGSFYALEQNGQFRLVADSLRRLSAQAQDQARLLNSQRGLIIRAGALGGVADTLVIDFDGAGGAQMVSLQSLGQEARGDTYVALEITSGASEAVAVQKRIRRYAADGTWLVEITDLPLDYFVTPEEEFRVRNGVVYQLLPRSNEVLINIWDTN